MLDFTELGLTQDVRIHHNTYHVAERKEKIKRKLESVAVIILINSATSYFFDAIGTCYERTERRTDEPKLTTVLHLSSMVQKRSNKTNSS